MCIITFMKLKIINLLILLATQLFVICGGNIYADKKKSESRELNIFSENLDIDKEKSIATFSNKVLVIFQDMELKADKIEVLYAKKNGKEQIDKIIIPGKLKVMKECGKEMALADRGVFDAAVNKLELFGNVILEKQDRILKTDTLIYHTSLDLKK